MFAICTKHVNQQSIGRQILAELKKLWICLLSMHIHKNIVEMQVDNNSEYKYCFRNYFKPIVQVEQPRINHL